jgi:hypothetical protein
MTNEHEASMDDPTESQLAELVRAAAGVALPEGVRAALSGADLPSAGPAAGELWRARRQGGGGVVVVWLRSITTNGAVAVPVSFDTELADEDTLVLPADASPLGLPLALHLAVETTVDRPSLLDRLGSIDAGAVQVALAARAVVPVAPVRLEDEFDRAADEAWWPLEVPSGRADLLKAIHQVLGESHPGARIAPRPAATAGSEHLSAVALVAELDAFVLVAVLDGLRAAEILTILNRRERLLLAAAGTPVRELRSVIGVGPSQAAELQARLRAVLAAELQDDEGYEAVFFHLVDQAKAWARQQAHQEESQYHPTGQPDAIARLMNAT